ncbi:hypothetical protein RHMOL_Rhmol11G0073700 [Rhododendron molle]|uniref:Uncharacterized protein n=1 Tax=Rhododendron molle TaxID=49168 RepID=A0ACC0LQL1_RHOML|nr:hypothetical protein RHMOL_Rhmol11G0073700 [Rhododendron molle]
MRGNGISYSIGLFSIPKAGHIIKAPEELVYEEHPLLPKPTFLGFYYTKAGQKVQSLLKA